MKSMAKKSLRPDFKDSKYWDSLVERTPYRLPDWNVPCSDEKMNEWLKRLKITYRQYVNSVDPLNLRPKGVSVHQDFIDMNPTWPLRAWVGLAMEMADEKGLLKSG